MKPDDIDGLIDDVAREMTAAERQPTVHERVMARLEDPHRPRRTGSWIAAPVAAGALLVAAMLWLSPDGRDVDAPAGRLARTEPAATAPSPDRTTSRAALSELSSGTGSVAPDESGPADAIGDSEGAPTMPGLTVDRAPLVAFAPPDPLPLLQPIVVAVAPIEALMLPPVEVTPLTGPSPIAIAPIEIAGIGEAPANDDAL